MQKQYLTKHSRSGLVALVLEDETHDSEVNLLRYAEPNRPDGWLAYCLPWRGQRGTEKLKVQKKNFQKPAVAEATAGFLFLELTKKK